MSRFEPLTPLLDVHQGTVAILLSTHNGASYLEPQLNSILAQRYANWQLVISDDGSSDATLSILKRYQQKIGAHKMQIRQGPCQGFCANFMSLACDPTITADFFAFCDQDDVWWPEHLERAVNRLAEIEEHRPALFCSRTHLIDQQGHALGRSPLFAHTPSFHNALVQSLAGGNTMVFNAAAKQLLTQAGRLAVVSHDWWAYLLVTGAGGWVHYDPAPSVAYRQHGQNLVGANSSLRDRWHRLKRLVAGDFKQWNSQNLLALKQCQDLLQSESRHALERFISARESSVVARYRALRQLGLYRQTLLGNIGLHAAALLGRL